MLSAVSGYQALAFMCDMHDAVERRDSTLRLSDCKNYLRMLANPALRETFYNPFIHGLRYTFRGNGARIVHASARRKGLGGNPFGRGAPHKSNVF